MKDSQSVQHNSQFFYSSDGFLVKQVVDGVETRFVRDVNFNTLQERDSSNNVTCSYVWDEISPGGIGGLLELTTGGQHYDYLYDGKGNVSALIDANQNVVASYRYDGFGKLLSKTGSLDQPYQFSTKYYYPGLGLNYYGYRFYNPVIGKWMTRDPLEEDGGVNLYAAIGNNSINYIDEQGEFIQYLILYLEENPEIASEALDALGNAALATAGTLGITTLIHEITNPGTDSNICKEHTKGKRPSTYDKHTKQRPGGREKADDVRRRPTKRPEDYKQGPWPPKRTL